MTEEQFHGAATQIYSAEYDRDFLKYTPAIHERIERKLSDMGMRLRKFPHQRLKGIEAFKLRVGEYRVIYQYDVEKNEILLIATGHRREVYKKSMS